MDKQSLSLRMREDSPLSTRGPKEWVKAFPVWGFVADPEVYHYK